MSTLPFDPEKVAIAARARSEPIPIEGYFDDDPGDYTGPNGDGAGDDTGEYPGTNGNGGDRGTVGNATGAEVVAFTPPPPAEGIIPLGYDQGIYFYLSRSSRQIHAMNADQHTRKAMMSMASVPYYWQRTRFITEAGAIQWDAAADWLMSECRAVGIYNPDRVRGRGAWFDQGRAVLHLGDRLLVDGRYTPLVLPNSTAIYPAARPLSIIEARPLSTSDANQICAIAASLRWKRPISATLFSGWIVCAFVCGALKWRPSIWIDGSSGSGKSWLQDNILAPLVGPVALLVQSKTSEAGIRQTLNSDALPIVFDEFEREDATAAIRVQGVLDLMRQSSSESEKKIIKGTQNQARAMAFRIRSCFAFSSINVGIAHAADESRVTILSLLPPATEALEQATFQELAERTARLITPAYAAGMLARAVSLLPTIRENAEVFAIAVAGKLGTRRLGDQLGTLLAGAYSLYSPRVVTLDEAAAYIDKQDWGEVVTSDQQKDEDRLLSYLTAYRVRFAQGNGTAMEVTMGRLISAAFGDAATDRDERIARDQAISELKDYGIKIEYGTKPYGVFISTNHPSLARILAGTPWATNWSRALARLPDVTSEQKAIRFGLGHVGKATFLPLSMIDRSGDPE